MSKAEKTEEFYRKLKSQLLDTTDWPSVYLFKFIVSTDKEKISKIEDIFNNLGAVITTKQSKKGSYTSISVNVRLKSPDTVIEKYKEVGEKIEGVISL